jgi:hypothetical protein
VLNGLIVPDPVELIQPARVLADAYQVDVVSCEGTLLRMIEGARNTRTAVDRLNLTKRLQN